MALLLAHLASVPTYPDLMGGGHNALRVCCEDAKG